MACLRRRIPRAIEGQTESQRSVFIQRWFIEYLLWTDFALGTRIWQGTKQTKITSPRLEVLVGKTEEVKEGLNI